MMNPAEPPVVSPAIPEGGPGSRDGGVTAWPTGWSRSTRCARLAAADDADSAARSAPAGLARTRPARPGAPRARTVGAAGASAAAAPRTAPGDTSPASVDARPAAGDAGRDSAGSRRPVGALECEVGRGRTARPADGQPPPRAAHRDPVAAPPAARPGPTRPPVDRGPPAGRRHAPASAVPAHAPLRASRPAADRRRPADHGRRCPAEPSCHGVPAPGGLADAHRRPGDPARLVPRSRRSGRPVQPRSRAAGRQPIALVTRRGPRRRSRRPVAGLDADPGRRCDGSPMQAGGPCCCGPSARGHEPCGQHAAPTRLAGGWPPAVGRPGAAGARRQPRGCASRSAPAASDPGGASSGCAGQARIDSPQVRR